MILFRRLLISIIFVIAAPCLAGWTRAYQFHMGDFTYRGNMAAVKTEASQFFDQLLVSWNAHYPDKGYYTFHLRVFDQTVQKWLSYPLYEWGVNRKKSFHSKQAHGSYNYVRFEGSRGHRYKRFEVVVRGHAGADIKGLQALTVCASTIRLFKAEPTKQLFGTRVQVHIKNVPCYSQHHEEYPESCGWCSPTAIAQLIAYYTQKHVSIPAFARQVYDEGLGVFGSWPFNMIAVSLYLPNFNCYVTRLENFKKLIQQLRLGHPVIVSIRCNEPLQGAPKAYPKGHLITVVGVNTLLGYVICNDTAVRDSDCVKYYPLEPFVRAWENSYRLAYIIAPVDESV